MILADGMGGEAGGAQASRAVVETFIHDFPIFQGAPGSRFERCLGESSDRLRKMVQDDPSLEGMGTTVVAVHYDGEELSWLSVGDSPMWLFSDGNLVRLNADHSMAQILDRMVENGELTAEEARNDRTRNMLLSAVTGAPVAHVDCVKRSCRLKTSDCILVASDGIQTLSDEEIESHLIDAEGRAEVAADLLLSAVRAASGSGQDNMTFLLLYGEPPEQEIIAQEGVLDAEVDVAGRLVGAGKKVTALFWVVIGLVLTMGLMVVTVSIWWPGGSPSQDTASTPEISPVLNGPSKELPIQENLESTEQSETNPMESRTDTATHPVIGVQ